jgi:hypothetical protein
MNCKICTRTAVKDGFCEFHHKAAENLKDSYPKWSKAMGTSWKEYLSQVAENPLAGDWVKEVAKYLSQNGET